MLACSVTPDEKIYYQPNYSSSYGSDLFNVAAIMIESRQVNGIPVLRTNWVEHFIYKKR